MGSHAYSLPFRIFSDFFTDDYLDDGQGRWLSHVRADRLVMNRTGKPPKESRSVRDFHNAFDLLNKTDLSVDENLIAQQVADAAEAEISRPQGQFAGDAANRMAIEQYAVKAAMAHFAKQGFIVEDVGSTRSYDVSCSKDGREIRVEVKGTTSVGDQVILTPRFEGAEMSRQARTMNGGELVEAYRRSNFEMRALEFWHRGIDDEIGRQRLRRKDR